MTIPERTDEGFIDIGGVKLRYLRSRRTPGSVPTMPAIVLAHGVSDSAACWASMFGVLERDFDVVAYDARGHGQSDAPATGYAPRERAGDMLALIDALSLEQPILMGHSMGGETAGFAALARPGGIRALVIEDAGIPSPEIPGRPLQEHLAKVMKQWLALLQAKTIDELLAHIAEHDPRWPAIDRLPWAESKLETSPHAVEAFALAPRADLSSHYPDLPMPTLLLKADAHEAERARHRAIVSRLPDGEIVHIDRAGHSVRRDEPGPTAYHLGRFLARVFA